MASKTTVDQKLMLVEYSNEEFKNQLLLITNHHGSINSLATWCILHHDKYPNLIYTWLKVIKKIGDKERLYLFHLAGKIIQMSKTRRHKYVEGWTTAIKKALPYLRDEEIKSKMLKVLKIWRDQAMYIDSYLAELTNIISAPDQNFNLADPVQEFQVHSLAIQIFSCEKSEEITNLKMKNLNETNMFTNNEAIQNMLKDQPHNYTFFNQLNDAESEIESLIKSLKYEMYDRAHLVKFLEVAASYNDKGIEESKKAFESNCRSMKQIKLVKSELESLIASMPIDSPIPSLDVNSSEIDYQNTSTTPSTNSYKANENPIPATHIQLTAGSEALNIWSTDDTPVSPPFHEQIPNQDTPIIGKIDGGLNIDHCTLETKMQDENGKMIVRKILPQTSDIDYRNLISVTRFPFMDYSSVSPGIDHQAFPDISMLPPSPDLHMEPVIKSPKDNVERVDTLVTKIQDKNGKMIVQKILPQTSDIDYRNLIGVTRFPFMDYSSVSPGIDHQAFPDISMLPPSPNLHMEPVIKSPKDNVERVDIDLRHDKKLISNLDQKHPALLPQPLPLPMGFDLDQQSVPDVVNQWDQSSQQSNGLNFLHNKPRQWSQCDPPRENQQQNFKPKWKRRNND